MGEEGRGLRDIEEVRGAIFGSFNERPSSSNWPEETAKRWKERGYMAAAAAASCPFQRSPGTALR